jgi:Tol biopolymer transport system component
MNQRYSTIILFGAITSMLGSLPDRAALIPLSLNIKSLNSTARIAFTSGVEGIEDVYIMNIDGSGQTNITKRGDASHPTWSPDGSKIAFVTYSEGNHEIYVANADGSDQINLTNNDASDLFPTWSPDGKQIAFASYRDGNCEVYVMDIDGSNPVNLTRHSAADGEQGLSWSPDGRKIVFTSDRDSEAQTDRNWYTTLFILDVESLEVTPLTYSEYLMTDRFPQWSPDGSKVVFVSSSRTGWSEIYTVEVDNFLVTRLTHENTDKFRYSYMSPSWSPNGKKIAFTACGDGELKNCEIYVMNIGDSETFQLTDNNLADLHPVWQPIANDHR